MNLPEHLHQTIRPGGCLEVARRWQDRGLVDHIGFSTHGPTDLIVKAIGLAMKKNPKTVADTKTKLNFPPFQHYKYNDDGALVCVGKSHWEGGMENGYFNKAHGQATNKLAMMWMKLCDRYATRGNVRGYTYNDEMRGQAILQLAQIGLQFDESKSENPFAYYTAAITNSFTRVLNLEKKNQSIRDDILESAGLNPSYTRQTENEIAVQKEFGNNQCCTSKTWSIIQAGPAAS